MFLWWKEKHSCHSSGSTISFINMVEVGISDITGGNRIIYMYMTLVEIDHLCHYGGSRDHSCHWVGSRMMYVTVVEVASFMLRCLK